MTGGLDRRRAAILAADVARCRLDGLHVDRLGELLETGGDVFSRYHYLPGHVTGSAFVIHPDRRAVALVHHQKLGIWVQPGGHVEPDDPTVEHGARREVAEEIGIVELEPLGLVDVDIHTFPAHRDQPTHLHFDVRYGFVAGSEPLVAGDGVVSSRWAPVEEALAMEESIARAVRRIAVIRGW